MTPKRIKQEKSQYTDRCMLKGRCGFKRNKEIKGKTEKITYKRCTFPDTCNQKKRITPQQIVAEYKANGNRVKHFLKQGIAKILPKKE